jgi:hypothetical protein
VLGRAAKNLELDGAPRSRDLLITSSSTWCRRGVRVVKADPPSYTGDRGCGRRVEFPRQAAPMIDIDLGDRAWRHSGWRPLSLDERACRDERGGGWGVVLLPLEVAGSRGRRRQCGRTRL